MSLIAIHRMTAERWTTTAAYVAHYLETILAGESAELPLGYYHAARRFFENLQEGLRRGPGAHEGIVHNVRDPIAYVRIALPVFRRVNVDLHERIHASPDLLSLFRTHYYAPAAAYQLMLERVQQYDSTLRLAVENTPVGALNREVLQELHSFMKELQRRGNEAANERVHAEDEDDD